MVIPPIDHQMCDAVRTGNLVVVIWFLDHGWEVDRIHRGRTAMHVAAKYGRVLIARTLYRRGANLEAQEESDGATPLLIAARHQHVAFVQWSLRHHANPNVFDGFGWAPIHYACCYGNLAILDALHAVIGPDLLDIRLRRNTNPTPLHIAAGHGQFHVVTSLAQLGNFEVDIRSNDGNTPFLMACGKGNQQLAYFLADDLGADVRATTTEGLNALHKACANGHVSLLPKLIENYRLGIETLDNLNRRPIHLAVQGDHLDLVEDLQRRGANFEGTLEIAASRGNINIVQVAIGAGAATNPIRLRHAIVYAAQNAQVDVVFLLLRRIEW